ncbi:MAG: DUF2325 domain-containing protein [Coriobacteriia bacterium]
MTVAVVGGLGRLAHHYSEIVDERADIEIKVFNEMKRSIADRLGSMDGVILCTNLVSHAAAREVYKLAREKGLSLVPCHRGSISAIRECVALLADGENGCDSVGGRSDAPLCSKSSLEPTVER